MISNFNHSIFIATILIFCITMAAANKKKSHVLVGGWTEQDVNSVSIKEWAAKAVNKFNQETNDINQHIVTQIYSAQSQVVAGTNYKLRVQFGLTNCKKTSVCSANEPVVSTNDYEIIIFSQPWTNTEEISIRKV